LVRPQAVAQPLAGLVGAPMRMRHYNTGVRSGIEGLWKRQARYPGPLLTTAALSGGGTATASVPIPSRIRAQRCARCVEKARLVSGHADGIDCALELFREHEIRCIFATAHGDEDVRARAQPAKPLGWIQKPYSMASLIANVRKVLDASD
jgi:hypothetical protein